MLPDAVRANLLEIRHEDYSYHEHTWRVIQDIREGTVAILKKVREYLPKRPGEEEELYKLRTEKASWTPVMSTAIRELTTKLAGAPIHISGGDSDFWKAFREDTNGKGRDEQELLSHIFSSLLYFGRLYVAVDRPVLETLPRSAYEDKNLKTLPYVSLYEPLAVTNYGEGWYMTRQVDSVVLPLEPPKTIATWVIWDAEAVTKYQAEVRLQDGAIHEVKVGSKWLRLDNKDALVPRVSRTEHGLGASSMLYLELPTELWTGNSVYSKQLQHFRVESAWTDAGTMAGVIQRVFTPVAPKPMTDERVVYEEPDYSQIKTGNQHVLVGADFKFQESPGTAIANLTDQLETIERQIRAIVSMSQGSVSKEALEQSGASKSLDREPLEDTMKSYGTKVAKFYQDILELVAKLGKQPEDITVAGLSDYGTDNLGTMLEQTEKLVPISDKLPGTAQKLWYGKLANLMAGSRTSETDQQIQEELEDIFQELAEQEEPEETKEDPVAALMAEFDLTEEEALEVLAS